MEQLGIDFNATGSVMSKAQLEEQRRKRGECLTCGRKCYNKKLFKMIPITDHGRVLEGRCLNCRPLRVEKESEVLPADVRPATQQDMVRFKTSQSKLSGPGVASPSAAAASAPPAAPAAPGGHGLGRRHSVQPTASAGSRPPGRAQSAIVERVTPRTSTVGRSVSAVTPGQRPPSSSSMSTSTNTTAGSRKHKSEPRRRSRGTRARNSGGASSSDHSPVRPQEQMKPAASKAAGSHWDDDAADHSSGKDHAAADYDLDGNLVLPEHGVLDRGGEVIFDGDGKIDIENLESSYPPVASMTAAESNRTLSSMSSQEEERNARENGSSRGRSSRKPAAKRSSLKPRYEDGESADASDESSPSQPADRRGHFGKSSPQVSARSLMSASSPQKKNSQVEAEQRALQKIQRSDDDFKEIVKVMKLHPNSDLIQQEAFKSLSNFHFTREDYSKLSKLGASQAVVEGMQNHPHSSEVQVNGCRAVWNLSATTRSQMELMKHGALDVVLAAMDEFPDDAEVQEKAMAALSNLGAVEGSDDVMMESGVIERIVAAMNNHSEDSQVQMKGCAAITNLASHDSPLKAAIVKQGGGGAVVVSMVMHTDEVDLQEKALRALRNICANNEENKVIVAQVGGIDAVISAMQVHRDEPAVQEAGAWTLSNLAANAENKGTIGDSGGIDVIIRAMWVHSDTVGVQEWCCRALLALSTDVQNRHVIIDVGGISAMVNAMQAHADSATVQEKCCGTLSNLAALSTDTKLRIVDEEALDCIVMAMVLHENKQNVQDRACSVLRRLAIKDNIKQMQAANVPELVRKAMKRFPKKCKDRGNQILAVLE